MIGVTPPPLFSSLPVPGVTPLSPSPEAGSRPTSSASGTGGGSAGAGELSRSSRSSSRSRSTRRAYSAEPALGRVDYHVPRPSSATMGHPGGFRPGSSSAVSSERRKMPPRFFSCWNPNEVCVCVCVFGEGGVKRDLRQQR